jgi:hypothetical protein
MNKWQDITTMEVNKGKEFFFIFRTIGPEFRVQRISTYWHNIASEAHGHSVSVAMIFHVVASFSSMQLMWKDYAKVLMKSS